MKVLQVNYTMNIGGIESFLMNVFRNMDRDQFHFTFLTYFDQSFDYEEEIKQLGGKIIRISNPKKINIFQHIKEIYRVIKEEEFDVVHCHTYFDSAYVMLAAKMAKVPVRIVHSHTSYASNEKSILKKGKYMISRLLMNYSTTHKLACSKEAGYALYGNDKFEILPNGIDFEQYYFDEEMRKQKREELHLKNKDLVLGHVGRFDVPKNHKFLIEIMSEVVQLRKNVRLILVGDGFLKPEIESLVQEKKLENHVLFLGSRSDVNELLNCFDLIVFPSIYEGLPVTLVEAQANGLKSLISDNISKEIKLSECIQFYSIEKSAKDWAKKIIEMDSSRVDSKKDLLKSSYSIQTTNKKLIEIYLQKK